MNSAPMIVTPNILTVKEDEPVVLYCISPGPVKWYFLDGGTIISRLKLLVIPEAKFYHNGQYVCNGRTSEGFIIRGIATVTVRSTFLVIK